MSETQPAAPAAPAAPVGDDIALAIRGLVKVYGNLIAVADLSLDIPTGSFYGIVGPNGAGKTTTLTMATGLLTPDRGTAYVHGVDVWARTQEARALLGVMPDGMRLLDRLSGPDFLVHVGMLHGLDASVARERAQELLAALDLAEAGKKLISDYSAGMTKKIALAAALIHSPRVLVLDEPFEAVDPVSAANIRQILTDYTKRGGTVILSSHVMATVQHRQGACARRRNHRRGRPGRRPGGAFHCSGRRRPLRGRPVVVGQLIRLKLRIIWNTVRKQTVVLVLAVLGALYFGAIYASALVGTAFLARSDEAPQASSVMPIVGPFVFLLWLVLPIIFASMDNSVDPVRLSPYVGPSRRLGAGLAAATAVGPGGLLSAMVLFLPVWFALWRAQWIEALGWFIAGLVTLPLAVLWARAVGTWFAVRLDTSGKKDAVTVLGAVVFMMVLTPMGYWMSVLSQNFSVEVFQAGLNVALWTPFGAPFGVVASLLEGAWVAAALRVLIVVATALVGWRAWLAVLRPVMSGYAGEISADAQRAIDDGRHLIDESLEEEERGRRSAQSRAAGLRSVDLFTRLGLGVRSASLAARTLRYWIVDTRLNMNMVLALLFPVVAIFMGRLAAEGQSFEFTSGIFLYLVPITTGLTTGALMQYDSTGAWIVVSSGMSGREERRGRLVGSLIVFVPQVIGYLIHDAVAGASASDFMFHQVMGVVLFAGAAATTLVVNARWVYPVQPPGTSPLATKGTGSFLMTMLLQLVGFAGTAVLQIPSYVLLVLASFGVVPDWVAYVVGIAWSVLVLEAAVRIGGRVWDRYAVAALTSIRSWPGH